MVRNAPSTTPEALLREAIGALDSCVNALSEVGERVRSLQAETENAHRVMRQHLIDFGIHVQPPPGDEQPDDAAPFRLDHEAILRDELALQQTLGRIRSLNVKVEHLANLVLSGKAQVLGSDSSSLAAAPWAAAVRAARIEAQEDERARLAREVHDGPAQVLANAITRLELCKVVAERAPQQLPAELRDLRNTISDGLVEVRRFMFDLRPSTLATSGLNATVRGYAEQFQQAFNIPLSVTLPNHELDVDTTVQIVLFRVVQESLQNAQKHAKATAIQIELAELGDGGIRLAVIDDGCGFDRNAVVPSGPSGAGLIGMEERAAIVGGYLLIDSVPGKGTTIALQIPSTSTLAVDRSENVGQADSTPDRVPSAREPGQPLSQLADKAS